MMPILTITNYAIQATLTSLQEAGRDKKERVLLWLAPINGTERIIREVYLPLQETATDFFWIPREGMVELLSHLRQRSLMIAAQVHSHPFEAFHSAADNKWAIIRHVGALSFVVPDFALRTVVETFVTDTALFSLSKENRWIKVHPGEYSKLYRIIS